MYILLKLEGTIKSVGKTNILELNGKKYDARSGVLVAEKPAKKATGSPKFVDGFRRPSTHAKTLHAQATASTITNRPHVPKPVAAKPAHLKPKVPAKNLTAHVQQHTHTLMRSAVKKPDISLKKALKTQHRTDILAKVPSLLVPAKQSVGQIDGQRLERAERISKSKFISRFGSVTKPQGLPIVQPKIEAKPEAKHKAVAKPAQNHRASLDIFEEALKQATSHKEQHHVGKRLGLSKRTSNIMAAALAAVLLGGFFVYQNIPSLQLKLAAHKAGISAELPGYHPSGYALTGFTYNAGNVAVNYHSTSSDGRQFSVVQQASAWDSKALLSNYVATAGGTYQAYQEGGRTIFVYGTNATWVDGGIWFNIESDNSLSPQQLLRVAASM